MIYEKLLEFIHEYAPDEENDIIAIKDNILRFDDEPQYIQKRFILNLFDEIFDLEPEEYRAKKTILLAEIFGKEDAIKTMHDDVMLRGKPPIAFLEITFGVGIAEELIKYTQQQLGVGDIELMDDYEQIMFVLQVIESIIGDDMPEWVGRLKLSFAQYLKYGPKTKEVLNQIATENDRSKLQRFIKSLKKLNFKYSHDDIGDIVAQSHQKSEKAQDEYNTQLRIQKELARRSPEVRLMKAEQELVGILGKYIGDNEAQNMIVDTKKQLGVESVIGAPELARQELMDRIMAKPTLQAFSPQRQAILRSYFRTWLNLS